MKSAQIEPEASSGHRVGALGESLVEAGWLTLLLAVPLLSNIYASQNFDPVKIGLLRGVVLVMLLGAVLALLGGAGAGLGRRLRSALATPLVVPLLAVLAASGLACVFSIVPQDSLWGSHARRQGLLTELCLAAVFLLILGFLRREAQWRRAVHATLLSSVVVAGYAVIQQAGYDPLPFGRGGNRLSSSLGNPTALASYILLAIFLGLGWLASFFAPQAPRQLRGRALALGIPMLALQTYVLTQTGSRAPLLGLLVGLGFMGLAVLARRPRSRALFAATLIPMALAVLGLSALTLSDSDAGPLSRIAERGGSTRSADVRILVWGQAIQMLWPRESAPLAEGYPDPWQTLRPWVGYGPDALGTAYAPYRNTELERTLKGQGVLDHMHGDLLNRWVASGLLGLLCALTFFGGLLLCCLRWLGLLATGRDRWRLGICFLLGSALALPLWKLGGIGALAALGPAAALLGGMFAFLATHRTRGAARSWSDGDLWLLALGGGLVGHFFEAQLGVGYAAGQLLFWTMLAAFVLRGKNRVAAEAAEPGPHGGTELAVSTLAVSIVFAVLVFDFLIDTGRATSLFEALRIGLGEPLKADRAAPGIALGLLALLTTGLALGLTALDPATSGVPRKNLLRFVAAALTCALLFMALRMAGESPDSGLAFGLRLAGHGAAHHFLLIGLTFLLACALQRTRLPLDWRRRPYRMLLPALLLGIALLGNAFVVRPLRADVLVEYADAQRPTERPAVAVACLDEALRLWPGTDELHAFRGTALLAYTRKLPGSDREGTFLRALEDLKRARELRPLEPRHALNLGRSYRLWALHGSERGKRYVRLREALSHSDAAKRLSPGVPAPFVESARTLALLGDLDRAVADLRRARSLDPESQPTLLLLAPALAASAQARRIAGEPEQARELSEEAVVTLRQLLEHPHPRATRLSLLSELADHEAELEDFESAIASTRAMLKLSPRDARIHDKIALLYERVGNPDSAQHRSLAQELRDKQLRDKSSTESFDAERDLESVFGSWFDEAES